MSGRIADDTISQVRGRVDFAKIVGDYVDLRRSGASYKGLCPFHEERTPSFYVNVERQFFHCFGCQESGDVFAFLMRIDGRRFDEVVVDLAERAGIEIVREGGGPGDRWRRQGQAETRSKRKVISELNGRVSALYRELLRAPEGRRARTYLEERGIGAAVGEAFKLGVAPAAGDAVAKRLQGWRVAPELAEEAGLVLRRRAGGDFRNGQPGPSGFVDRFWNRLIFPLMDASGGVLGFGGRILGNADNAPKYLNTPETVLYRKGEILYGLHAAKKAMRQTGVAILVEGNIDVLQMHQHGFQATVAPMGTAVTDRQLQLIRRFVPRVVALFDADDAGSAAARRVVGTMITAGIDGRIALLPKGEDPDSYLRSHGREGLERILEGAQPALDYLLSELQRGMAPTIPDRARVLEELAPLVAALESAVSRDLYVDRLSMALQIDRAVVARSVRRGGHPSQERVAGSGRRAMRGGQGAAAASSGDGGAAAQQPAEGGSSGAALPAGQLDLVTIVLEHPHLFDQARQENIGELLTNDALRATYSAAVAMYGTQGTIDIAGLLQTASADVRQALANAMFSGKYSSAGDPTRAFCDCVMSLRRQGVEQRLFRVRAQISEAQAVRDDTALASLRPKLIELVQERRRIHETR